MNLKLKDNLSNKLIILEVKMKKVLVICIIICLAIIIALLTYIDKIEKNIQNSNLTGESNMEIENNIESNDVEETENIIEKDNTSNLELTNQTKLFQDIL